MTNGVFSLSVGCEYNSRCPRCQIEQGKNWPLSIIKWISIRPYSNGKTLFNSILEAYFSYGLINTKPKPVWSWLCYKIMDLNMKLQQFKVFEITNQLFLRVTCLSYFGSYDQFEMLGEGF